MTSGNTANTKDLDKSKIDYSKCKTLQTYDIEEKLTTARIALMIKKPFFGNLATRMRLIRSDDWLPTAAVDGKNFYYNSAFIDALSPAETEFLFGHEVLHLVFDHILRVEDRNPQLFNIAADYIVNQTLVDEEVGKFPTTVPGLLDSKYKGMITEEVYELLKKQWDEDKTVIEKLLKQLLDEHDPWKKDGDDVDPNCPVHGDNPGGDQGDEEGDGEDGDEDGKGKGSGDGEDGDEDGDGDGHGRGKKPGGKQCTCNKGGQPGIGNGSGTRPSQMTEAEKKELKDQIKESILTAAQAAGAGNVPANVRRMIQELTEPRMNWRELLQQQIQSTKRSDFSFMRPNRKSQGTGCVLPGMVPEMTIDICIAIDMSGSISQKQATDFLSEVDGIMEEFLDFKIQLWCFDTKVYGAAEFSEHNREEINEYKCKGGGGTDFDANWVYMKKEGIEPKKFIMFTDGEPWNSWGDEDYCDTVFIIHNTYNKSIVPPFGEYAYYDAPDEDVKKA